VLDCPLILNEPLVEKRKGENLYFTVEPELLVSVITVKPAELPKFPLLMFPGSSVIVSVLPEPGVILREATEDVPPLSVATTSKALPFIFPTSSVTTLRGSLSEPTPILVALEEFPPSASSDV
jgi:hypothetical protein